MAAAQNRLLYFGIAWVFCQAVWSPGYPLLPIKNAFGLYIGAFISVQGVFYRHPLLSLLRAREG